MIAAAAAYVWTPSDYFGMWQLIVAALGLGFAGWQLLRTANATEASSRALQRRLLHNDLIAMLPEIHSLEDGVEKAVRLNDRDLTSEALVAYSRRVSSIVGALKADGDLKDERLTKLLGQAAKSADEVKASLYNIPQPAVDTTVHPVQDKMRTASRAANEVQAMLQKAVGESKRKGKSGNGS